MSNIKSLRERERKTQEELAQLLKISQQQYSNIEKGKADINGEKIIKLCKLYNISADYILGLIEEPRTLRD